MQAGFFISANNVTHFTEIRSKCRSDYRTKILVPMNEALMGRVDHSSKVNWSHARLDSESYNELLLCSGGMFYNFTLQYIIG